MRRLSSLIFLYTFIIFANNVFALQITCDKDVYYGFRIIAYCNITNTEPMNVNFSANYPDIVNLESISTYERALRSKVLEDYGTIWYNETFDSIQYGPKPYAEVIDKQLIIYNRTVSELKKASIEAGKEKIVATIVPLPWDIEVRAEESLEATYDERGEIVHQLIKGKIIAINKEAFPLEDVNVSLEDVERTNLSKVIHVDLLKPGPNVIASYEVEAKPRLTISEEWKSVSYEEKIDEFLEKGLISPATAKKYKENLKRIVYGQPNLLEFELRIRNLFDQAIKDITISNLLPDVLEEASSASPGISYDPMEDKAFLPKLDVGEEIGIKVRGKLSIEKIPFTDYLNLTKTTWMNYSILVEAGQKSGEAYSGLFSALKMLIGRFLGW